MDQAYGSEKLRPFNQKTSAHPAKVKNRPIGKTIHATFNKLVAYSSIDPSLLQFISTHLK
jgi:hypothetical protein